jgi:hypothetical protein
MLNVTEPSPSCHRSFRSWIAGFEEAKKKAAEKGEDVKQRAGETEEDLQNRIVKAIQSRQSAVHE